MRWLTKDVVHHAAINSLKATIVLAVVYFVTLFTPVPAWFGEPIAPLPNVEKVARAAFFLTFMAGALFCVGLIPSGRNDGKR